MTVQGKTFDLVLKRSNGRKFLTR